MPQVQTILEILKEFCYLNIENLVIDFIFDTLQNFYFLHIKSVKEITQQQEDFRLKSE